MNARSSERRQLFTYSSGLATCPTLKIVQPIRLCCDYLVLMYYPSNNTPISLFEVFGGILYTIHIYIYLGFFKIWI
jgi:hypothetical protein